MPMPTGGAWPPPAYAPAYAAYRDWDAWYSGDPDKLRSAFANRGAGGGDAVARARPSQYAGGVIGRLSRWFWGAPMPTSQRDPRLHVPIAADVAATSAKVLFGEAPKLTVPTSPTADAATASGSSKAQDRLDLLYEDGLRGVLLGSAEVASALGDVYLRAVIDEDVLPGRGFLSAVHADGALPVLRWGRLVEVTFWQTLEEDGHTSLRLLEHHTRGRVEYALFKGNPTELGMRVPFTEHPVAKAAADQLGLDDNGGQDTGLLDRLDVVRIPNVGQQRRWRCDPTLKYLGRSDYDGAEPLLDSIDEIWSSWLRDIRLAKGRVIVPDVYLQSNGPGQGATFDPDREVYSQLNMLVRTDGASPITAVQFEIRFEAHKASLDQAVEMFLRHAGWSVQTFGEEGDVAMTATETQARERRTTMTRNEQIDHWGAGVPAAIEMLTMMEAAAGLSKAAGVIRPLIEFADGVSEGPETVARTAQLLKAAEAASTETLVRLVHPDWEDEQVTDEVGKIEGERQAAMAPALDDPTGFGGPGGEG